MKEGQGRTRGETTVTKEREESATYTLFSVTTTVECLKDTGEWQKQEGPQELKVV